VALGDEGQHEGLPCPSDALIDYDRVADIYDLYAIYDLVVGFFVEEAGKVRGKVLDLMCGTGRVSVPLLEAEVDLTCVDASEGMLTRLQERLHACGLAAQVVRADVRYLDLREE
jgi:ubiquinone/menaquinone biosynthesis C-methylase UbiE